MATNSFDTHGVTPGSQGGRRKSKHIVPIALALLQTLLWDTERTPRFRVLNYVQKRLVDFA